MLIVDSREPESIQKLFPGATVKALAFGDFQYTQDDRLLLIERKSPSDLTASILDGRLGRQCEGMIETVGETGAAFLVITGNPVQEERFRNLIESRMIDCQNVGIVVVVTNSIVETVKNIIRRFVSGEHTGLRSVKKIQKESWQMNLLKCVPGVGHTTARKLLALNTLDKVLSALIAEKDGEFWMK